MLLLVRVSCQCIYKKIYTRIEIKLVRIKFEKELWGCLIWGQMKEQWRERWRNHKHDIYYRNSDTSPCRNVGPQVPELHVRFNLGLKPKSHHAHPCVSQRYSGLGDVRRDVCNVHVWSKHFVIKEIILKNIFEPQYDMLISLKLNQQLSKNIGKKKKIKRILKWL